jgi:hypothetical protein
LTARHSWLIKFVFFTLLALLAFPLVAIAEPWDHTEGSIYAPTNRVDQPVYTPPKLPAFDEKNCYSYLQSKLGQIPRMAQILPNQGPVVGAIAIFNYHGTKHIAYVESVTLDTVTISECNMQNVYGIPCGTRTIPITHPHLLGFYAKISP